MQIDIVRHLVVGMIVEMEFDEIAFADADEFAGDAATEGPESVIDAVGEAPAQFAYFQVNDDFGGVIAMDRRRYAGGKSGLRVFLADDPIPDVLVLGGGQRGRSRNRNKRGGEQAGRFPHADPLR